MGTLSDTVANELFSSADKFRRQIKFARDTSHTPGSPLSTLDESAAVAPEEQEEAPESVDGPVDLGGSSIAAWKPEVQYELAGRTFRLHVESQKAFEKQVRESVVVSFLRMRACSEMYPRLAGPCYCCCHPPLPSAMLYMYPQCNPKFRQQLTFPLAMLSLDVLEHRCTRRNWSTWRWLVAADVCRFSLCSHTVVWSLRGNVGWKLYANVSSKVFGV